MKKKRILIITLLGITFVIWGIITLFISSVKKDQKEMNSRMETIISEYTKFGENIEKFNEERDNIHSSFLDTVFYETLEQNDAEYKKKLYDYERQLSNISKETKKIREYCKDGIYYSSSDVNLKCSSFKQSYEEMVNYFVEDINLYNKNITDYNSWLDSEGKTNGIKLEPYNTTKTYIDYNKDGEYSGKEEENEKEKAE